MKKERSFLKTLARDFLALGSIPFFLLVTVRVFIAPVANYHYQLLLAFGIIVVVSLFVKNQQYIAMAVVLLVYTSLYYADFVYTLFARIAWVLMVVSSYYLERNKMAIIKGTILGAFATLISYFAL